MKIIIVSNRLPVTVVQEKAKVNIVSSAGGLATSLKGLQKKYSGSVWIGYPGDLSQLNEEMRVETALELENQSLVPVTLPAQDYKEYYDEFSNKIIWPLFHYSLDRIPLKMEGWESYLKVNRIFLQKITELYQPGDIVWIQDYHLMLLPKMIRESMPDARIGFFLHIPFPASEVFRILPWKKQILEGLLGSDLLGFHTYAYMRNFTTGVLRILGIESNPNEIIFQNKRVSMGVFPISIDADFFENAAKKNSVSEKSSKFREDGKIILLGIDRLDYTKGIPRRILAFGKFLDKYPEYIGRVKYVQVAVPSRDKVSTYIEYRKMVDELVGRINGKFSTLHSIPIHYLYRSLSEEELLFLYKAADIMLVTPLRDGMNLVAKEYVVSNSGENGILILSEYAGAADELNEAVIVNPFDIDQTAESILKAIQMPSEEKKKRMMSMKEKIRMNDIKVWGDSFIDRLLSLNPGRFEHKTEYSDYHIICNRVQWQDFEKIVILSDYDGTLTEFKPLPELAIPSSSLLQLMKKIEKCPKIEFNIISGRNREFLEKYVSFPGVNLYAEHGFFFKSAGSDLWQENMSPNFSWKEDVKALFENFSSLIPGTFTEEKASSIVWHYRNADPEAVSSQLKELKLHLWESFSNAPIFILPGNKILEVRAQGVSKSNVSRKLKTEYSDSSLFVLLGDDTTDQEMFEGAGKENSITVAVGDTIYDCQFRLKSPETAIAFLDSLANKIMAE